MSHLSPEVKLALEKINFIDRYKQLSKKYDFDLNESFEKYDNNEVITLIKELGYDVRYYKKENFFKIQEEKSARDRYFHISLKYGIVELIWWAPWGVLKSHLDGKYDDDKIKRPVFRNYTDLRGILQEAFAMYEDYKRELLSIERN